MPVHDDQKQFEFLMMEVMQCGLNWNMMIQKREIFRGCFDNFDFDKVSAYSEADIERIMGSVTVYSHLQACGIINDHWEGCYQYRELISCADAVRKQREQEN